MTLMLIFGVPYVIGMFEIGFFLGYVYGVFE